MKTSNLFDLHSYSLVRGQRVGWGTTTSIQTWRTIFVLCRVQKEVRTDCMLKVYQATFFSKRPGRDHQTKFCFLTSD